MSLLSSQKPKKCEVNGRDMKYIYKIFGKVSLLCYILMMYRLWHLCKYGDLRGHLPLLAVCAAGFAVTLVLWLIARSRVRKDMPKGGKKPKLFYIEALVFLVATLFFCGGIAHSATPSHGALARKIDDFIHRKQVVLTHNNILKDGVEGILTDLDKKLDLPEELYVSGKFQVTFDAEGTVQTIATFLYGKHESGKTSTYLVEYDADKGKHMTVWLDGHANDTYEEDMRLQPMLRILKTANWQRDVYAWSKTDPEQRFELFYAGRREFAIPDGLQYLPGDADGDGIYTGKDCISSLQFGGNVIGYEVSLGTLDTEDVTPIRYIMEPSYVSAEEISQEHTDQQIEQSKDSMGWEKDPNNGSMYFFLTHPLGWRLTVTDAACGSRFYILEKTEDGGATWEVLNEDPFLEQAGVAEGLIFFDEHLGIAGLAGPSQAYSRLYLTRDGGITFEEIQLPMDKVTKLPESAEEFGLATEDYDYLCMPEIREKTLKITVTPAAQEEEGLIFSSEDSGKTWTFLGPTQDVTP